MITGLPKKMTAIIMVLFLLLLLSAIWIWYGVELKKIDSKANSINTTSN